MVLAPPFHTCDPYSNYEIVKITAPTNYEKFGSKEDGPHMQSFWWPLISMFIWFHLEQLNWHDGPTKLAINSSSHHNHSSQKTGLHLPKFCNKCDIHVPNSNRWTQN